MDSENQIKETGVSGPLKHLLSIDWENAGEIPHESDNNKVLKNHKRCKKVRFAEELEHLKFIDFDDQQECDDDQLMCGEDCEGSIKTLREDDSPILENSLQLETLETEDKRTLRPIDYEEKREAEVITGICEQVTNLSLSVSPNSITDGSVELSKKRKWSLENENESATSCKNLELNSAYVNNMDADFESWKVPERNEQTQLFKMALKKPVIRKQSSKINSLLEKNNFTCPGAAELQKAVFQAWCEVKTEQKMKETEKNKILASKNNEKKEKIDIDSAYMKWKKSKEVQKRRKRPSKIDPDSYTDAPNLKDKEESKAVFKMWKEKKDAILMKRKSEESRLEQEQNVNLLINAELRKEEADLAFAAWKHHKYELLKKEKQKQVWMQLKEKEKDLIQHKRNKEAMNAYLKWLEKKEYSNTCAKCEDAFAEDLKQKAPWYPP